MFDPSRAPQGKHTAWAYCHVPNGSTLDVADRILTLEDGRLTSFAEGLVANTGHLLTAFTQMQRKGSILHHIALAIGPDERIMPLEGRLMDLAAEIGLTHEALYRTLAELEKEGAIRRTRAGIALRKRSRA